MQARNPVYTEATQKQVQELTELGWYHSIELPGGEVIPGLQSLDRLRARIARFPLPEDLSGKRVLDIGAWDGWFSFEMERRGAEVMAVDSFRQKRFELARDLLQSRVEYRIEDVCRLTPNSIGTFDYVLFFGVLYHVKHPILALENVCRLTRETAFVESYVTDDGSDLLAPPVMEFYETTELRGQFDNWVGPNTSCLMAFCRTAGFARVALESVDDNRAHLTCYRQWAPQTERRRKLVITAVENSVTKNRAFFPDRDEYITIWFKSDETTLNCENVFPQVGPFATKPVHVSSSGADGWMVNCKLPLGLADGPVAVRLSTPLSSASHPATILIGEPADSLPVIERHPEIVTATDGITWERNRVRVGPEGGVISLWLRGLPPDVPPEALDVRLGEQPIAVTFCSQLLPDGLTQINATVPAGVTAMETSVSVSLGGFTSPQVPVTVTDRQ